MLFIVFTEIYTEKEVFKKIGVPDYSNNGQDMILLYKDMSVQTINSNKTDLFPEKLTDTRLVFINDFLLKDNAYILDVLFQIIETKKELYILFHENGKWNNQRKQISELINGHRVYEYFESHKCGSLYYEEIAGVADAIEKKSYKLFETAINKFWTRFYLNCKRNFLKNLESEDLVYQIDNLTLPEILRDKLITTDKWIMFRKEIRELKNLPEKQTEIELNNIINRYFS